MSLHIGILQTDSVLEHLQPVHGDYPNMFMDLFLEQDPHIRFTNYVVQDAMPETVECDAYIVTGSRLSVYDDEPWIFELAQFIARALNQQKKLIGICFGHQLMAHFFGGLVAPAPAGWAVGIHTSQVEKCAWMQGGAQDLSLLSSHKDQVQQLPQYAQLFASNDFCPMAGFTLHNQVITIQGHPEFNKDYARALMTHREDILGERVYSQGIDSLAKETHSETFVRWALSFARQNVTTYAPQVSWTATKPSSTNSSALANEADL
ncbi:amidotransferase [Pseudomonadales bacterium]|nr:amidotransferase [Pseudomonadales bacterium]